MHERADAAGVRPTVRPVTRLGIDDFSLRRGRRYATGFHDLEHGRVLEVVEGRPAAVTGAALERLVEPDTLAVVSMDMAHAYRAAVQLVCPTARITVNKFHVIKRVQEAVRAAWRRLVRGRRRDDPLHQDGRLVRRTREALTAAEAARLGAVAHAPNGDDPVSQRAELAPEPRNVAVHDAPAPVVHVAPHALEQEVATEGPPRVGDQQQQEVELGAGHLHLVAIERHRAGCRVDAERPPHHGRRCHGDLRIAGRARSGGVNRVEVSSALMVMDLSRLEFACAH